MNTNVIYTIDLSILDKKNENKDNEPPLNLLGNLEMGSFTNTNFINLNFTSTNFINLNLNFIETELKKTYNVVFIACDQYELNITLSELLDDTDEELFIKQVYSYIKE
jgi:hypothetical protein